MPASLALIAEEPSEIALMAEENGASEGERTREVSVCERVGELKDRKRERKRERTRERENGRERGRIGERVRERDRGKERESANEGDKQCEVERKREHALAIQRPMFTYNHTKFHFWPRQQWISTNLEL